MTLTKTGRPARRNTTNPVAEKTKIIGAQWQATDGDTRMNWNNLNRQMQNPEDPQGPIGFTSGYTAFFTVLTNLMTIAAPINTQPPSYAPPPPLPPVEVNITFNGGGNTLVVTLLPNVAIPAGGKIVLWGTRCVPLGNSTFGPRAWRKIGIITGGIPTTGVNAAPQYLSVFPKPLSSSKIGIKMQVIGDNGLHTVPLETFGISPTLSLAGEQKETDADDLHIG